MTFDLDKSLAVLQRTPEVLRSSLSGLSDDWTMSNYGEKTFSPFDVVGHLIEADQTNWMPRLRHILEYGDTIPFPAFDRYAMFETSKGKSLSELLDHFANVRAKKLADLRALSLTPEQLEQKGQHPDLGAVALSHLLAAWVVHDLGHIHQIVKSMAFQYRDAVGPWREYLTILPKS
jgi:hypothetical protein